MSGPQFTPGPWKADKPMTSSRRVFMPGDTVEIRDMGQRFVAALYRENFQTPMDEANARLIAAAPELYEALTALCDGMDDLDRAVNRETFTAARAALAKARGEK